MKFPPKVVVVLLYPIIANFSLHLYEKFKKRSTLAIKNAKMLLDIDAKNMFRL
jgi:hypothetical protein